MTGKYRKAGRHATDAPVVRTGRMTTEDQTPAHTTTPAAGPARGSTPSTRSRIAGITGDGRWPATAVFFLNGLTLSTYMVRLVSLKSKHHLSDGQIGLIGVLFAVAALACMQGVGPVTARVGIRPVLRVSLIVMPVLLALSGVVDHPIAFAVAVTALGAVNGTTDAVMNAHAITIERGLSRPVLNGCHAAWSVSVVVASLTAAILAHTGVTVRTHLVAAAAVLLAAGLVLGPLLKPGTPDSAGAHPLAPRRRPSWREGWSRTVMGLGLAGMVLMICEGVALAWSAIFLHDSRGASLGLAATAVTAYTGAQTVGRLIGDRLALRFGAPALFRTSGLIAAFGLTMALLTPDPLAAVAGFAVTGLGTSVLLPLAFSAAGQGSPADPSTATLISRFTTFTYAGVLLGPAVIGWSAEVFSLFWTLSALIPMLFAVALLSRLPGRPQP